MSRALVTVRRPFSRQRPPFFEGLTTDHWRKNLDWPQTLSLTVKLLRLCYRDDKVTKMEYDKRNVYIIDATS